MFQLQLIVFDGFIGVIWNLRSGLDSPVIIYTTVNSWIIWISNFDFRVATVYRFQFAAIVIDSLQHAVNYSHKPTNSSRIQLDSCSDKLFHSRSPHGQLQSFRHVSAGLVGPRTGRSLCCNQIHLFAFANGVEYGVPFRPSRSCNWSRLPA